MCLRKEYRCPCKTKVSSKWLFDLHQKFCFRSVVNKNIFSYNLASLQLFKRLFHSKSIEFSFFSQLKMKITRIIFKRKDLNLKLRVQYGSSNLSVSRTAENSILTSGRQFPGVDNFRGILNFCLLMHTPANDAESTSERNIRQTKVKQTSKKKFQSASKNTYFPNSSFSS